MKKWQFWFGVAISGFFLYWVLKDIEFHFPEKMLDVVKIALNSQ